MALSPVIDALVTVAGNLSGIVRAYADPPESISEFPAAVVYAQRGALGTASAGMGRNLHTIRIDLYTSRTQLPEAVNSARAWPDVLHAALADAPTLGVSGCTIDWPVTYEAIAAQYNNLTHYGLRFEVTVKIVEAL
jgi:hypothetical protein